MTNQIVDDARSAYTAWRECPPGSYVERVLADSIVRDIVPALIHAAERVPMPIGFNSAHTNEVESDTEVAQAADANSYDNPDDEEEYRDRY